MVLDTLILQILEHRALTVIASLNPEEHKIMHRYNTRAKSLCSRVTVMHCRYYRPHSGSDSNRLGILSQYAHMPWILTAECLGRYALRKCGNLEFRHLHEH